MYKRQAQRHKELQSGEKCDAYSRKIYEKLADGKSSEVELASALLDLSALLHTYYGIAPIIIIDEYDTPIQQGYMKGYYDEVIRFMRNLFSGGFKDNPHLSFGFLTGILRVAKESIFSRFTILTKTPNMQKIFLLYSNAFFRMMTFRKSILKMYSTV